MLLEYNRAYTVAKLESIHRQSAANGRSGAYVLSTSHLLDDLPDSDLQSRFVYHVNNCLDYLFSDDFAINCESFPISRFSLAAVDPLRLSEHESIAPQNKVVQSILVMQDQFDCFKNEFYQIYILQRAVEHIRNDMMAVEEQRRLKDTLSERIFNACKTDSEGGVALMHKSCSEITQRSPLRLKCIKKFFERLVESRNIEPIRDHLFDNQTDVKQVLHATFGRIEELLSQR